MDSKVHFVPARGHKICCNVSVLHNFSPLSPLNLSSAWFRMPSTMPSSTRARASWAAVGASQRARRRGRCRPAAARGSLHRRRCVLIEAEAALGALSNAEDLPVISVSLPMFVLSKRNARESFHKLHCTAAFQ